MGISLFKKLLSIIFLCSFCNSNAVNLGRVTEFTVPVAAAVQPATIAAALYHRYKNLENEQIYYDQGVESAGGNDPLDLEPFIKVEEVFVTNCGHLYKREDLENWLNAPSNQFQNLNCPVCRNEDGLVVVGPYQYGNQNDENPDSQDFRSPGFH